MGEDEKLDVEFLGHFGGQDGHVYGEWEEFSIPLSQSFIDQLKTLKGPDDKKFIGDPINIEFFRTDFETVRFKILPSEILAAIYGLESGTICDPEYEQLSNRYTNLCPAIHSDIHWLILGAISTGRRNTLAEPLSRCFIFEGLSGTLVERPCYRI